MLAGRPWRAAGLAGAVWLLLGLAACLPNPAVPAGDPGEAQFTIRVTGTQGLPFSGNQIVSQADGTLPSTSSLGSVPTTYQLTGVNVSVVYQKLVEAGTLRVEIIRNGQVINAIQTTAPFGAVTASSS